MFREHPQLSNICIDYIKQAHRIAEATVPLMQEVIECAKRLPDDPVSKPLIQYMKKHIAEEMNHDEWYVNDLDKLNISREDIFSQMPSPNMAALIGSQSYWIKHHHPVAFMGYMTALETNPPTEDYVNNLINASGLPKAGFDTLMMHAKIDISHKKDIIDVLNSLPLTEQHFEIIEISAFQTFRYIALIMEDICKVAPFKVSA